MKSAFVSLATAVLFAARVVGQTLQINTPANVVVCQPIQLTWSGGTPPYILSVLPGSQPSAPALENLGTQTGTSFTWNVDIAAGTSVGLTIRDQTGATGQSAPFTINPGTDSSCVGKGTSSASGSSTTAAGTGSTTSAATATGTTPTTSASTPAIVTTPTLSTSKAATTTSPATSTTKAAASSAAATTTSTNGGPTQAASFGAAGLVGAAVIALLA